MERFIKIIILLMVAAVPAAVPRDFAASPTLCFNSGSTTFALAPTASMPDYRVKFVAAEAKPDLRIQLVDDVAEADLTLVDDFAPMLASPCSAGRLTTIRIVAEAAPADVTVSLSGREAEYRLFVHSARFSHRDAAAVFAAVLRYQNVRRAGESD